MEPVWWLVGGALCSAGPSWVVVQATKRRINADAKKAESEAVKTQTDAVNVIVVASEKLVGFTTREIERIGLANEGLMAKVGLLEERLHDETTRCDRLESQLAEQTTRSDQLAYKVDQLERKANGDGHGEVHGGRQAVT